MNKTLLTHKIRLIHFDAHPDLSLPSNGSCINDWKDPIKLNEILNSQKGISEFIIPLIANGILYDIAWIRSPWSNQIEDDEVTVTIFDVWCETNQSYIPSTTHCSPYFIDDGSVTIPTEKGSPKAKSIFEFDLSTISCEEMCRNMINRPLNCCSNGHSNWILVFYLNNFTY